MDGPQLIAWTIRISLLAMAGSLLLHMVWPTLLALPRLKRWIWTIGCVFFWLHTAAGMHFYHHWSQLHAYEDTAQQTFEALGVRVGAGIYVNYLMGVVWVIDTGWWWMAPANYAARSRYWSIGIVSFFLFIAFNGLIVFKQGALRWSGIAGFAILAVTFAIARLIAYKPSSDPDLKNP